MTAPPGRTSAASAPRNRVGEMDTSVGAALVSRLVGVAKEDPAFANMSANRISRLVRAFIASQAHERDLVSWLISYSDPTGETAVRNVMAGR